MDSSKEKRLRIYDVPSGRLIIGLLRKEAYTNGRIFMFAVSEKEYELYSSPNLSLEELEPLFGLAIHNPERLRVIAKSMLEAADCMEKESQEKQTS